MEKLVLMDGMSGAVRYILRNFLYLFKKKGGVRKRKSRRGVSWSKKLLASVLVEKKNCQDVQKLFLLEYRTTLICGGSIARDRRWGVAAEIRIFCDFIGLD